MYFEFMHIAWLWLLLLLPILFYAYLLAKKKKKQQALKFSNLAIIRQAMGEKRISWRNQILFYLTLATIFCLIISLADPHIPLKQSKEGVNVILVLDNSGSMQAQDYKPNRLDAAKQAAKILIKNLDPKDEVGIIVFESAATTAAYLSPFKDKVLDKLEGIAPREGRTAIGDGLSLGIDMASSVPNKKRVLILLSDGVNNAGVVSPAEAIAFAKASKIQVFSVGMGSEQPVVLGYDFFGNAQYAELDEATLKEIALQTGGKYYKSVDSKTLQDIYSKISKEIKREKEPTSIKNWFIILAIAIILAELYIRYGRYRIIQ